VYRGLDIGTAKPPRELRDRIPHHLIDICEPTASYSAGQFVTDAIAMIRKSGDRHRIPLLVGGTMLYLRALMRGIADLPRASPEVRESLERRAASEGWAALHRELAGLDPAAAAKIHPNDPQRIQRALEVFYTAGRPISELQRDTRSALDGEVVHAWALVPTDRAEFHASLEFRFNAMMRAGFLEEVRALRARGDLTPRHSAIRAVGYRQLWGHLDGEYDRAEAVRLGVAATRQLAKRQLTWLRSEPAMKHIDPRAPGAFENFRREAQTALHQLGR
jgi:tRNA dimethylallyltransferase